LRTAHIDEIWLYVTLEGSHGRVLKVPNDLNHDSSKDSQTTLNVVHWLDKNGLHCNHVYKCKHWTTLGETKIFFFQL